MIMNSLCGWVGWQIDPGDTKRILLQMAGALSETTTAQIALFAKESMGVAAPYPPGGAVFADEELLAAIDGRPVYADCELQRMAQRQGPAEALAAGYRKMGREVLGVLNGSFRLVVMNYRQESALLAVDRLAIRSMIATVAGRCLVFGSSAQAVASHPLVDASVDPQAVFNYVYFHVVPAPGCIYKSFIRLLPGTYLHFSRGRLSTGSYWKMDYRKTSSASFASLQEELFHLLEQSVRRQLDGKTVGAFLSGGTDSSTVAGMIGRVTGQPARTYSIGFDAKGYDEMKYARITARHFGTQHHEYYVTPDDVLAAIPAIAKAYGNPYGNSSAVPTYYCALCAKRDGIDVMLAGDGGDELFAGNARYARQWLFSLYERVPRRLRESAVEPMLFVLPGGDRLPGISKLHSYARQASVPMPERLEIYNLLNHLGAENVFTPTFLSAVDCDTPIALLRQMYKDVRADDVVNKMLGLDLRITLADNDLPKVTRMCELAGVEARFPLLDEELVAFSAKLPAHLKLKRTQLRFFFKRALRDFLPAATLTKTKHGFGLPFGSWLYTHAKLQQLARDNLKGLAKRDIIKERFVGDLMDVLLPRHPHYYGAFIWVLMMLEQWFGAQADWQFVAARANNSAASALRSASGSGPKA